MNLSDIYGIMLNLDEKVRGKVGQECFDDIINEFIKMNAKYEKYD